MSEKFIDFEIKKDDDDEKHRAYSEEMAFCNAVANGDIDTIRKNCQARRFSNKKGVGILSKDPVQNLKYHFVITAAMLTRVCLKQGVIEEQCFRLSDFYIQKLDLLFTEDAVCDLHDEMVMEFTRMMRLTHDPANLSKPIASAINYIYIHGNEPLSVDIISQAVGVSPSYLSRLFKKEMGVCISEYIRQKKIETAVNLLRYSPYSMVDIANRLSFSSQSHFIQTFKRVIGITPLKYREKYGKSEWKVGDSPDWL